MIAFLEFVLKVAIVGRQAVGHEFLTFARFVCCVSYMTAQVQITPGGFDLALVIYIKLLVVFNGFVRVFIKDSISKM